jgi:hypothetical protein
MDVNENQLPVRAALVEHPERAQDFGLLELAREGKYFAGLAGVEGVVVTLGLGFGMYVAGVLPGLMDGSRLVCVRNEWQCCRPCWPLCFC